MPAMIVIGGPGAKKLGSKPGEGSEESDGDDEEAPSSREEARMEASRAVIKAVKMSDPKALDQALEAHYEACSGAEE